MIKIYINNVLQKTEILPSNTPTKDETLETFSFALMSNTSPLPLASMQKVKVDFKGDGSEIVYFYIVSDSVETISLSPLRYKHNISCIQNTRELSKHLVRNSSFTQPFYLLKNSFNTEKRYLANPSSGGVNEWRDEYPDEPQYEEYNELNANSIPLITKSGEMLTKASLKISFQYGVGTNHTQNDAGYLYAYDHNANDIVERLPGMEFSLTQSFTLSYIDENDQPQTRTLTPYDFGESEFDFNKTYDFPLIVELAKQGCNNFEILFDTKDMLYGEFISSTNKVLFWMMQVSIEASVYYYTCYDILQLLLNRQAKETSLRSEKPLFVLPQDNNNFTENQRELARLLKNTIAPNFTFTDLTMYECVAEVFRVFDAIFNMDDNRVLGIDYFNDLSGENITTKAKFTGRTLALGEDKYTNGLVANYQDARIIESFPRKEGEFAHLRSAEFGVPEPQDHNFIVPHNIDNILKCEIVIDGFFFKYFSDSAHDYGPFYNGWMTIDITRYVLEQSIWSTLEEGDMSDSDYVEEKMKKTNCVYYIKGDNKIQVGFSYKSSWFLTNYVLQCLVDSELIRLSAMHSHNRIRTLDIPPYSILRGDWKEIKMRAIYITTVDGKTKVHSLTNKYPGETIIDQANGAVDLNKFGLNMLGLSMKLGNPTLNATHKITSWADRIKIGQIYEWPAKDPITGETKTSLWVANVVNYTFMNGKVQGKVSFIQNFNALSLRTQLLREKRMSNISRELVQKSEETLTDFVYFSSIPFQGTSQRGDKIHFNPLIFKYLLWDSLAATPETNFKVGDSFIHFNEKITILGVTTLGMYYIPLVKYGAGNTLNFEMSYDDPMNAGNQTKYENDKYFTNHIIYTEGDGFRNEFNIRVPVAPNPYTQDFPIATMTINYVSGTNQEDENDNVIDIKGFMAYKQPNEIFALNYQLAFLPLPGRENLDFIGNEFINNNRFVKDDDIIQNARYIVFKEEKSSNLDIKATPYFLKREITAYIRSQSQVDTNACSIRFDYQQIGAFNYIRVKSWALVDERDNVLFASNSFTFAIRTHAVIYFVTKLTRIN